MKFLGTAALEVAQLLREMPAEDAALVQEIFDTEDVATTVARVRAYYRDLDRAERTPRGILYLHLGLLNGVCDGLLAERES